MSTKEICSAIIRAYEEPKDQQERNEASRLIFSLAPEIKKENFGDEDLQPILETYKRIATTRKESHQILQNELLKIIFYSPHLIWENKEVRFQRGTSSKEAKIAELLITFAHEIYEIKQSRDAFGGKRRGYSLMILKSLSSYFDVPEFIELCSKSLKSKSKTEFIECVECLKSYCLENDVIPDEKLIELIDKRIEKTKIRTEAVSGLDLLVQLGLISEFEALNRIGK